MVKYTWYKNIVPDNLEVRQVYGFAFDNNKALLRIEDNEYKLTGGKPESNETYEETLKREYIEELNVELDDIHYLGYLLVEDNDKKYAQVRMIAKIKKINDIKVDPATNKIYSRELVNMDKIKEYLNYSDDAGNIMIDDAVDIAKHSFK